MPIGALPINEGPTEHGDEELVAAAQQGNLAVEEGEVGGRVDELDRRRRVLGAGLVDEVADVLGVHVLALGADGDAEQGEAVLRVADLGYATVRVGLQIWAVDGEAGDPRRAGRPEGDQDALALLLGPAPAAIGGGGVGAVAEVAERVEEDGLRKRRIRILGVDRRWDREQPEFVVIHAHGNRGGRCGGGGRRRNGSGTLTQGGEMNLWMG